MAPFAVKQKRLGRQMIMLKTERNDLDPGVPQKCVEPGAGIISHSLLKHQDRLH